MRLQLFLIGLLIAAVFIFTTTDLINTLQVYTGVPVNTSYNSTYNKINQTLNITSNATSTLEQASTESSFGAAALQVRSFPIFTLIFNGFGIIVDLATNFSIQMNLPPWFLPVILGIVAISILFAVLRAVFFTDL